MAPTGSSGTIIVAICDEYCPTGCNGLSDHRNQLYRVVRKINQAQKNLAVVAISAGSAVDELAKLIRSLKARYPDQVLPESKTDAFRLSTSPVGKKLDHGRLANLSRVQERTQNHLRRLHQRL